MYLPSRTEVIFRFQFPPKPSEEQLVAAIEDKDGGSARYERELTEEDIESVNCLDCSYSTPNLEMMRWHQEHQVDFHTRWQRIRRSFYFMIGRDR